MFFLLSKLLSFLLVPFNWIVIFIVIALFVKSKSIRRKSFITALILFLLFSNSFLFQKVLKAWEYPAVTIAENRANSKPILILGGLSDYEDKKERIHFKEASDRLLQGLLLHKLNPQRPIIISGGSAEIYFEERPEADYVNEYLCHIGVDSTKIFFETRSRNTYENAFYSSELFDSLSINKDITLITSAFHMRRAAACFKQQGFIVDAFSAHVLSNHQALKPADYFLPSLSTLQLWPLILKEWMGMIAYKMKGFI